MLRMSVKNEEYIMIGDDVKIIFLGGGGGQTRIMIDAPKEVNIVRSRAIEKRIQDPELLAKMPKYYAEPEHPEKYKKKSKVVIVRNDQELENQVLTGSYKCYKNHFTDKQDNIPESGAGYYIAIERKY